MLVLLERQIFHRRLSPHTAATAGAARSRVRVPHGCGGLSCMPPSHPEQVLQLSLESELLPISPGLLFVLPLWKTAKAREATVPGRPAARAQGSGRPSPRPSPRPEPCRGGAVDADEGWEPGHLGMFVDRGGTLRRRIKGAGRRRLTPAQAGTRAAGGLLGPPSSPPD